MAKINYPTQEYLDRWVDQWMENHPDEKISDFKELYAQAEDAWWLNEIEHNRPTPDDLTAEQEKVSQEARKGMAKSDKPRKVGQRERKPNEDKRAIMTELAQALEKYSPTMTNIERQLDFEYNGIQYSITLIAHRPPKNKT